MGINIVVYNNGKEHPDWDGERYENDKKFPDLIDYSKIEYKMVRQTCGGLFRPTDFKALRLRVKDTKWGNIERYLALLDLLESNSDNWLFFCC